MQGLGNPVPYRFETLPELKWRSRSGLPSSSEEALGVWSGTAVFYSSALYTQARLTFKDSTHVLS
jgi:hypothetical protein